MLERFNGKSGGDLVWHGPPPGGIAPLLKVRALPQVVLGGREVYNAFKYRVASAVRENASPIVNAIGGVFKFSLWL